MKATRLERPWLQLVLSYNPLTAKKRRVSDHLPLFTAYGSFCEKTLKYRPDKRLYKEYLREKCKGEIKADKLQPVRKQRQDGKALIIGIIEPCCKKAHGRAHQKDRGAYDHGLKDHRMAALGIKYHACDLK